MTRDRRRVLAAGGALIASCAGGARRAAADSAVPLDAMLEAHADVLPEAAGSGADHYPVAAEALETLDRPECTKDA